MFEVKIKIGVFVRIIVIKDLLNKSGASKE